MPAVRVAPACPRAVDCFVTLQLSSGSTIRAHRLRALQVRPGLECRQPQVIWGRAANPAVGIAQHGETIMASLARRDSSQCKPSTSPVTARHGPAACHGQACGIQGQPAVRPCCQGQQCTHAGSAQPDLCPQVGSTSQPAPCLKSVCRHLLQHNEGDGTGSDSPLTSPPPLQAADGAQSLQA